MTIRAVLFDLGNTLVGYYTSEEFPEVLKRCLRECATALNWPADSDRDRELFDRALGLNRERPDFGVRLLQERLRELFSPYGALDDAAAQALSRAFLRPIFELATLNAEAVPVLDSLRRRGVKTALVSNTPWGSPASAWRDELGRHGLLERLDAAVFCVDVGFRKPHRAPFERALELLNVNSADALFVGDDPRWDVIGAQNAGLRPIVLKPSERPTAVQGERLLIQNLREVVAVVNTYS